MNEILDPMDYVLNEDGGCDIKATFEKQAELSFKAGIKEVVEWIETHGGSLDGSRASWQSKLKEWGIE